jgi:transglutaminase-like putative cysteine protease
MLITIRHETRYEYSAPIAHTTQQLRLTPRNEPHQRLLEWHIEAPRKIHPFIDAFGNSTHLLTVGGSRMSIQEIVIVASGTVAVQPLYQGRLNAVENLSPLVFTVSTPLCAGSPDITDLALRYLTSRPSPADLLALAEEIQSVVAYETGATGVHTTAQDALLLGRGVCQDHAHLFLACCHTLGVPARYVSGYIDPQSTGHAESHAWVDIWIDDDAGFSGWISLDVTHAVLISDRHCRLAVGRDYHSAAPVRGVRQGGGTETMTVSVDVSLSEV